jgi:hypothetical protein
MNFKFWKRGQSNSTGPRTKLPHPKELSQAVGIYMISQMKEDPDWVWSLKSVSRPREGSRHMHDIRIFNPLDAKEKQIEVENFLTLDSHTDLILYFGVAGRDAGTIHIEKSSRAAA